MNTISIHVIAKFGALTTLKKYIKIVKIARHNDRLNLNKNMKISQTVKRITYSWTTTINERKYTPINVRHKYNRIFRDI